MNDVTLDAIRHCLDGQIPGVIATCSRDGVPNCSYISQVHYVDPLHVALSFQFFNKTHANVRANPVVAIMVVDPDTAARYRLQAHYLRTETEGAVFENMRAKLSGIASQTGMSAVFKLLGADIYRVAQVASVAGQSKLPSPPRRSLMAAVRHVMHALQGASELDELLARCLAALDTQRSGLPLLSFARCDSCATHSDGATVTRDRCGSRCVAQHGLDELLGYAGRQTPANPNGTQRGAAERSRRADHPQLVEGLPPLRIACVRGLGRRA